MQAVASLQLFVMMKSQELTPNVTASSSVDSACAEGVQAVAAWQLFERMGHDGFDTEHACEASGNFSGIIPPCALQTKANTTTTLATCDVVDIRGSNVNTSDSIARLMLENCTVVCAEGFVGVASV